MRDRTGGAGRGGAGRGGAGRGVYERVGARCARVRRVRECEREWVGGHGPHVQGGMRHKCAGGAGGARRGCYEVCGAGEFGVGRWCWWELEGPSRYRFCLGMRLLFAGWHVGY